ncbi:alpha-L-rhamnosidase [Microbacterium awajiense]|uniref:alpha-L-rhamnosidase n=1 Tax=Microbacterium awajiense TaxID=415214 RepID=A0ABP7ATU6_9MICO
MTAASAPLNLRADGRQRFASDSRLVPTCAREPRLSWVVPLLRDGQAQEEWHVRLCLADADPRDDESPTVFETHGTGSDPYTVVSRPLDAFTRYSWTVRVRDERGEWSEWADPARLETGPLEFADWRASWVTCPALTTLRAEFAISSPVQRARLHLTAQGLVRAAVNSAPVNGSATDATRVDTVRALVRTYDVTDLCRVGENVLDLTVSGGEWQRTGLDPRALAELVLDLLDGTRLRVGTSADMATAPSEVVAHEPFYLERHDPRATPSFSTVDPPRCVRPALTPSTVDTAPQDVQPDLTPPLHDVRRFEPAFIGTIDGARLFDVGVNVAGRPALELIDGVPAGTVVRIVHGEHLDATGRLDTTNITMPFDHGRERQALEVVATGEPGQVCTPWFAYYGFRFVEVQGLPSDAVVRLEVRSHHTDLAVVGAVETDDAQVNTLITRANRTLLNNVHGIPEDCPTREQAGWTGDTSAIAEFEMSAFDAESFLRKWLTDLRTSQQPDGAIPAIAPDVRAAKTPADPVWGSALQRILINHWRHYGDRRVVDENLPALRRWADFQLRSRGADGVVSGSPISYGHDWLALEQTPPPIHHTAATIDCLEILAELESEVGEPLLAALRRDQANEIRVAARKAFFDPSSRTFGNGSQGSYACALEADILTDPDERAAAVASIVSDVRMRGNRVSTGFAATRTVVSALAHNGHAQLLYDVLQQRDEPGVGAMLDHGPGTFWECWWIDPANTGTGSLDHVGLGGVFTAWAYQGLAGIRPIAAGYRRAQVAPQFVAGIDTLSSHRHTVRGRVGVRYRRERANAIVEVTVPVSMDAKVLLPGMDPVLVASGEHTFVIPWPIGEARAPVAVTSPWRAPAVAPPASDVDGPRDLLVDALSGRRVVGLGGATLQTLPTGLVCMPIPHAQLANTVVRVTSSAREPRREAFVRTIFDSPLDLEDAVFVYALVDLCVRSDPRAVAGVLALHGHDGTVLETTGRIWPAGWNRVRLDVTGWTGRSAVTAADVGIRLIDDDSDAALGESSFDVGEVGWSTRTPTW